MVDEYIKIINQKKKFEPFEMEIKMRVGINSVRDARLFFLVLNYTPFNGLNSILWEEYKKILADIGINNPKGTISDYCLLEEKGN